MKSMRRAPLCESLEGRQLLNRGWGFAGGPGMWDGSTPPAGKLDAAHVHNWNGMRAFDKNHVPGQGFPLPGGGSHGMFTASPQAKADMETLHNDIKSLQVEVPAALQAQLKADKATIDQALSSLTPAQRKAEHMVPLSSTPPSDPTAFLTAQLTAANVPSDKINQIVTDLKNYQTTLQTIDPTLYAKITADQAALAQDLPAGAHTPPIGNPGLLVGPRL